MGLAASQARLLSITSRMSDNELRSQLISNAKMRLATDSSRVSDEYIAALNESQMMFSNFNTAGDAQNQLLTFNSLTAYSAYNNQYGVVNNNGKILVSPADAEKFEASNNSLEEFLKQYDLEKRTSYFENYKNDPVYYYDSYGKYTELGYTVGELQEIYEGNNNERVAGDIIHYGYQETYDSREFGAYNILLDKYNATKETYQTELRKQQKAWFGGDTTINGVRNLYTDGNDFEYYMNKVTSLNEENIVANVRQYLTVFDKFYSNVTSSNPPLLAPDTSKTYTDRIAALRAAAEQRVGTTGYDYLDGVTATGFIQYDKDDNVVGIITSPGYEVTYTTQAQADADNVSGITSFPTTVYKYNINFDDDNYSYKPLYYSEVSKDEYDKLDSKMRFTQTDAAGTTHYYSASDGSQGGSLYVIPGSYDGVAEKYTITEADILNALQSLYAYYRDNTVNNLNDAPFRANDKVVTDAYAAYLKAATNLAEFIYGEDQLRGYGFLVTAGSGNQLSGELLDKYMDYLGDQEWVLSINWNTTDTDQNGLTDSIDKSHYNPFANVDTNTNPIRLKTTFLEEGGDVPYIYLTADGEVTEAGNANAKAYPISYQAAKDIFLMEQMLNIYGEPKYTWIDNEDPDENATAKAQWYSNLYERMQQGYTTIPAELQGSSEWMQFAFESGLVHMEQVDGSNAWVSTSYANCSNITEESVNVDVTVAEAKYTREMNKIQAKDQQYDIELKNIDTEHSALEQEYESIKSVISKNIERNYKLFQQG